MIAQQVALDLIAFPDIALHLSHSGASVLGYREGVVLIEILLIHISHNVINIAPMSSVVILEVFLRPLDTLRLRHPVAVHLIDAARHIFVAIPLGICNTLVLNILPNLFSDGRRFGRPTGTFAFAG